MAQIKFNVTRAKAGELIAQGKLVAGKLAPAAPATPPVPNMADKAAALLAKATAAETAVNNYEEAKAGLAALKSVRDAAVDDLRAEHNAVISSCEGETKGDPVGLTATGYPLAVATPSPSGPPGTVMNLNLTWAEADGALDGQHDPEPNAKSYEVQLTTGDPVTGPYATVLQPTTSSWKLIGLTSGQRVWVRVRAIGSKGVGGWSDPASRIVP